MKRVIEVRADDGDVRVDIRATIRTNGHLSIDEVDRIKFRLADGVMQFLVHLPYSRFYLSKDAGLLLHQSEFDTIYFINA